MEDGIPEIWIETTQASEVQSKSVEEVKLKDLKTKNFLFQSIAERFWKLFLTKVPLRRSGNP